MTRRQFEKMFGHPPTEDVLAEAERLLPIWEERNMNSGILRSAIDVARKYVNETKEQMK